ncbi:HalOD1 output domain-containing protein [Halomontanus rarus]|uniref:HalOD1 output domain-containing protein n=1 Tax=Halomontanus rarus TaxID=3034020 RepID=UPI001A980AED
MLIGNIWQARDIRMNRSGERDRYYPEENRPLSQAILELIEEQREENLIDADFRLYDDINPDALNRLFQEDAEGETLVKFDTGGMTVRLWADGAVDIQVTPQEDKG